MERKYDITFRCYFPGASDNFTIHHALIPVSDIPRWLEAYHFTHPNVRAISVKWWPHDKEVEA